MAGYPEAAEDVERIALYIERDSIHYGRVPLASLIRPHNIASNGADVIYQNETVEVTALQVPHGDAKPSYAYRFDIAGGCSLVFSGDTSGSKQLIELAKGADIFVHEVVSLDGMNAIVQKIDPGNEALIQHIVEAHTTPATVGKAAAKAGVDVLVLNHFVPTGIKPFDTAESWINSTKEYYDGKILVGEDLMEIKLDACDDNAK